MAAPSNPSQKIGLLARSLFPLLVMMVVSGTLGLPFMVGSNVSFIKVIFPYLLVLIGCVAALGFLMQHDEAWLVNRLNIALATWRVHFIAALLLVFCTGLLLNGTDGLLNGSVSNALHIVLLLWGILWGVLLGALYWEGVRRFFRLLQPLLIGLGAAVLILLIGEAVLRVERAIQGESEARVEDVDFQPQLYNTITDTEVEWAEQYWIELQDALRHVTWTPYVYWRTSPYDGTYINVDAQGIRYTLPPSSDAELSIHFYGGSTAWGYARAMNTPSPQSWYALLKRIGWRHK